MPIGLPHTPPVTGHECWLGKTGRILLTTQGSRIYTAGVGDQEAKLIARGNGFIHISASPDGRFFLVDNISTGRLHLGYVATRRIVPYLRYGRQRWLAAILPYTSLHHAGQPPGDLQFRSHRHSAGLRSTHSKGSAGKVGGLKRFCKFVLVTSAVTGL